MPPTTQHTGNKKKKILNKVSKQVKDGRIQNKKNVRKHLTAIWLERLRKLLLLRKKKKTFILVSVLIMVNIIGTNWKKRRICSAAALTYHYFTETYSRVRNFGNNHTFKQWALKKREFTYFSLDGTWGGAIIKGYVERDERNRFVVSKNDIIN